MATESANAENVEGQVEATTQSENQEFVISDVCIVTSGQIADGLAAPVIIEQPTGGEVLEVIVVPGQQYFFDFAEGDVQSLIQEDGNLTLTFADNSALVLKNFDAAASDSLPATLAFSNELTIDELAGRAIEVVETVPEETALEEPQAEVRETREEQVANIEPAAGDEAADAAQALAQIEPAAGDEGAAGGEGNTGFGFGSSFDPQGVNPLEDVGPIDPTLLQYGVDVPTEEVRGFEEDGDLSPVDIIPDAQDVLASLDESNLSPLNFSSTVPVDFNGDTPGSINATGIYTVNGSVAGPNLSSGGDDVVITATPTGYTGVTTGGVPVFTLVIDPTTGDFTYNQTAPLDHADGTNPDDVITFEFGVIAQDSDGDFDFATITINVADDAPEMTDSVSVVDETDLPGVSINGALGVDFGEDVGGAVTATDASSFSFDGSAKNGALTSGGDPITVRLVGDTYIGETPGGADVFTLVVNPDGTYTFDLLGTLDHADPNDPNDIINLNFGATVTDFDGDSADATITIRVKDDVPVIGNARGDVDETNLDGGPISTSDTVPVALSVEVASAAPDGNIVAKVGGVAVTLTSGLSPVVFEVTPDGYKGTINGGADTVFEVTIDSAGKYTYTQYAPFDHPDGTDPNDLIDIEFGVIVTDTDGDSDTGLVTISVADDGPIANDDVTGAEEGQSITGTVTANDDLSEDVDNTVTNVEFGGTNYAIIPGIPAVVDTPLGKLTLNADGSYTFDAVATGDPDGTLVFTYTLVDGDTDSDTAELSIRVTPDGQPIAVTEAMTVDETNLNPGPLVINESMTVDFGLDGPGTIDPNNTFTPGGSLAGGALTSGGVPVVVTPTADGYVGVVQGTAVKVFELIVQDNGDYSFELFQTLDHADSTDPNDLISLEFGVTIQDADDDTADGTITINVLDDAPVAYDDADTVLQNTLTTNGNVTDNDIAGEDAPSTVTSISFTNAGGTTTVPVVAGVATSIDGDHGTLVINADGTYEYTSKGTNIATEVDEFTYGYTDFDGDTDTAELTITIQDINTKPKISAGFEVVDETDLPGVQESGQLIVDFGADGPGTVEPVDGDFTSSGSQLGGTLTSNGEAVTVRLDGDTFIGEAPDGTDVFTLLVNPDGSYTFDLLGTLDHADPNDPNDIIRLDFGVVAIDSDEDATPSVITVLVKDDVPTIGNNVGDVDETNLETGDLTYSDTLFTDLGTEATSFTPANNVRVEVGGNPHVLTSEGEVVTLVQTPTGYEGTTPSNGTVFTLVMDDTTGQYVYTQTGTFDHPDGTDPNDTIELLFDFTVENSDGDAETGTVVISVADDGPIANDDVNGAAEGQDITGSVTANDDFSEDNPNDVTQVEFNGTTYPITAGTPAVIDTPLGQLTLNQDGSYAFDAVDSGDPDGTVTFTYTLVDSDGDSDTAELSIKVTPDGEPIIVSGDNLVDETGLETGPVMITDSLSVDFGLDGAGSVDPSGVTSFGGSATAGNLTSNDIPVEIRATANGYEGVLVGTAFQVFELIVQDNGDYSFELFAPLDHADGTDPNDAIQLNFGVTATDFGGDTDAGTITINVLDDAPIAKDDLTTYDTTTGVANGNVLANDDFSEDNDTQESADHDVVEVSFTDPTSGVTTTVAVPAGGSNTIEGEFGTLTIADDGSYSYQLKPGVTPPAGGTSTLDPDSGDVVGTQAAFTKNGITVTSTTGEDLSWWSGVGPGIGVGADGKVWPDGDGLDVDFDLASAVEFKIGDIGVNNLFSDLRFDLTFEDGSTETVIFDIVTTTPVDGVVTVSFDSADYGGKLIDSVELPWYHSSFVLSDVTVTHPGEECIMDEFEYVLQDGDGDQSTATLGLKGKDLTDDKPIVASPSKVNVDETDMDPQDEASGQIIADFGADGPGTYTATGDADFTLVSGAKNGVLTSNGNPVTVKVEGNDYVGRTADNTEIFRLDLNQQTGVYEFILSQPVDHADVTNPDDFIFLNFGVTVQDSDDDTAPVTVEVRIDDDGPSITSYAGGHKEPADFTTPLVVDGTLPHEYGEDGKGEIKPEGGVMIKDTVGGPAIDITSNGLDVTVTQTTDGYIGKASDGSTVFEFTINDDGQFTYTQSQDIDHPAGVDVLWIDFNVQIVDFDGDTADAFVRIDLQDGTPENSEPKLVTKDVMVDETDLDPTDDASNVITADFGNDGPGTYSVTDATNVTFNGALNNQLTSNGVAVAIAIIGNSYVGTANGQPVFTLDLNDTTGQYTFTLQGTLDHADATDPDDVIELMFEVAATDDDGDSDTGTITVSVKDDGPYINTKARAIDEDGLENGPISYTHKLDHDYGEDGAGEIRPTDNFVAKYQVGGQNQTLTAGGNAIDVNATATGYEGIADGEVIFTLVVQNDGTYTYTQYKAVDHPDATNPDDVIWLKFEVEIVDFDGDTDTAYIVVDLHDSGPVAHDDVEEFGICDDNGHVTGDVLVNDDLSQDTPNTVTQVKFGSTYVDVTPGQEASIDGDYGTLKINADGTYEYQLDDVPTAQPDQVLRTFSKDNPPGSDAAGDIKNVNTTYNETTQEFTFQMTIDQKADGFWVAINGGPNPKGHAAEMALIYFDATDLSNPVVNVYSYNGQNGDNSWEGANADPILNSIANADLFSELTSVRDGNGNEVYTIKMDASVIQSHVPANGPASDWSGVSFDDEIGIWLHPVDNLNVDYGADGFIDDWDAGVNGYYDTSHQPAHTEIIKGGDPCVCETNYELDPESCDVDGKQESFTKNGITVSVANDGEYDITWLDTHDGSGLGIDNLNSGDSKKVWPLGETFDIAIEKPADSVTITIAEIGDNNDDGHHGVDYVITFADGSTYAGEQQFVPNEIEGGLFDFTLNSADFGGKLISSIELNSINDGHYDGASFLLNNVEATCVEHLGDRVDEFEYVVTDADGDTSSATLTLVANPPQTITGTDGNDVINGGGDSDTLYGGEGADIFLFESTSEGLDTIKDFDAGEGDVLDVSGLLQDYDSVQDSINDFVFATEDGEGNTTISVDVDGAGGSSTTFDMAVLEGVTSVDIELITNNGEAKV